MFIGPMDIQDESPLPANPLEGLEDDYGHAVLHLAWDRHAETGERTLLFAFVELLPTEIPPPLDDYDPNGGHRLGGKSQHKLYVRHAVTSARRALDWYLDCRAGTAVLPDNDGTIPAPKDAAKKLKLTDLGEEPPWPALVSASDDSDALPFVPQWIECPRTHHLLPLADFDLEGLWSREEKEAALAWLEGRLHFDLREYPEYLGSVHLVAPNPVYREQGAYLERGKTPAESVIVKFQPRAARQVEGLRLLVHQKDAWGLSAYRWRTMRHPWVRLQLGGRVHDTPEDVLDPRRGFLHVSHYKRAFITGFSIDVNIGQRHKVIGPKSSYEVTRTQKGLTVGTVTEKVASGRARMFGAHIVRSKRRAAEEQHWFRDQKDEARDALRARIHGAQVEVLLIDAYFGAGELGDFMLAVGREDIPVHILTSSEVLKEPAHKDSDLTKGTQLAALIRQLRDNVGMNTFDVRVMRGHRPAIHDRFLAIDLRLAEPDKPTPPSMCIWLLGSSLNEFGSRGTMMLRLPDPAAVRDDLVNAWKESEKFEVWLQSRATDHGSGQTGEDAHE